MKTLTVFTPAYNRAHLLHILYHSLCRQTNQDFEWLVIDDGSSDNTKLVIDEFISENKIPIRYIFQQNQGMHGAHNTAYKNIKTVLNTCIDSDDFMTDNAVALILEKWSTIDQQKYAGIIGLDAFKDGTIIGSQFKSETTTLENFYNNSGTGDKKLVYRTEIVNKYPEYPLFEGENYVGLGTKYLYIDKDFELVTLNQVLVIVEYLETGSSRNMLRQYLKTPKGFRYNRIVTMQLSGSLKRKFIEAIHFVSGSIILKDIWFINKSPKKILTILAVPFGFALFTYIKFKTRKS